MPKVTLNRELGEELILQLYDAHRDRWGTYQLHNSETGPQTENMPGRQIARQWDLFEESPYAVQNIQEVVPGSMEHLLWLFFATVTDRRQSSIWVYRAHVHLYEHYPELYTADVVQLDPARLGDKLIRFKIGVPRQSAQYWVRCARTLFADFGGDPRALFEACGWTVEGVQAFKKQRSKKNPDRLPGYGPKITSLCYMFYAQLGVRPMPDDAFPVDLHVQRLFKQYGALTHEEDVTNEVLESILRPYLCDVSIRHALDKVELAHAFWQLGRTECTNCYRKKGVEHECPIARRCLGNADSHAYFKLGRWTANAGLMRKGSDREFRLPPDNPLFTEEEE